MAQLRLNVQTITPLLMYGADNKDDRINPSLVAVPELRASSIRGMLRYWLRAVLGSQYRDLKKIFEEESKILGSTDVGSKVQVRVQPSRTMREQTGLTVLPDQTKGFALKHTGFVPDSEFRLTLTTHPLDNSDVLNPSSDLLKAVFLMTHFGGLGRRSRRGSGNLRVLDAKGYDGVLPLTKLAANRAELVNDLRTISHAICPPGSPISIRPGFPVFAPDTAVVLVGQTVHPTYEDAFKELWEVSGPYHHEGGIFGDVRPRRASAIHMRVAMTGAGYVTQQTILYSGDGNWDRMRVYIVDCQAQGFDVVYGTWSHWK